MNGENNEAFGPLTPSLLNEIVLQDIWPRVLDIYYYCKLRPLKLVCKQWLKEIRRIIGTFVATKSWKIGGIMFMLWEWLDDLTKELEHNLDYWSPMKKVCAFNPSFLRKLVLKVDNLILPSRSMQ
jgi:hypothetical protein